MACTLKATFFYKQNRHEARSKLEVEERENAGMRGFYFKTRNVVSLFQWQT